MAVIAENTEISPSIWLMLLHDAPAGEPGQFVMLRVGAGLDPLLPRPLSIFDCDPASRSLRLLYQVAGRGTAMLAAKRPGEIVAVHGPYGNGFPTPFGPATLIGGGIGIAPLYLLARRLREAEPGRNLKIYLGYRGDSYCEQLFLQYGDVHAMSGGFITEAVDFGRPGTYFACGPEPMLRAAQQSAANANAQLYLSLEKRMACGAGACLGCTIQTSAGNRRVCKDGPVFSAEEVIFHA